MSKTVTIHDLNTNRAYTFENYSGYDVMNFFAEAEQWKVNRKRQVADERDEFLKILRGMGTNEYVEEEDDDPTLDDAYAQEQKRVSLGYYEDENGIGYRNPSGFNFRYDYGSVTQKAEPDERLVDEP